MIPSAIFNTIYNAFNLLIIIDMNPQLLPPYPAFIDISEPHLEQYSSVNLLEDISMTGCRFYRNKKVERR